MAMKLCIRLALMPGLLAVCAGALAQGNNSGERGWAEIRVLDAETGRGVPLVELETVNSLRFVTDNAGRVAFQEPGLMGREVYFTVRSHGYEPAKDGFGFAGFRFRPEAGTTFTYRLKRANLAERLCRLTGEGLYRDTLLLGHPRPLPEAAHPGGVGGQDSVQAAAYRRRVYWFWGDTQRMDYPLGLFRMAGATTPVPDPADPGSDPAPGLPFDYFVDAGGFARAMMPLPERPEGVVWVSAVFAVADERGVERLVAHYSRRKGLADELEQGIAVFNDEKDIFEPATQLPLADTWRRPRGHPVLFEEEGDKWLLFGSPSPNVRVRATLPSVLDPSQYEALTCLDRAGGGLRRDGEGRLAWRWQKELPPADSETEQRWVKDGWMRPQDARFFPADARSPDQRIVLHSGSVRWNPFRERWILLAGQIGGGPSFLGEVWYSEARRPTGPFGRAVRVVTHDRQSFYNVCHHAFLDRDGGRVIHFEGTYTHTFSGNPERTPRYDYNQVLYRLRLDNPALRAAAAE